MTSKERLDEQIKKMTIDQLAEFLMDTNRTDRHLTDCIDKIKYEKQKVTEIRESIMKQIITLKNKQHGRK